MGGVDRQELVTRLALSHGRRLRRFLGSRVRNPADIPDIVQEVFLRLMRMSSHETIRTPEAYLFTVAHNVAMQQSLRESARPVFEELDGVLGELEALPDTDPVHELRARQCIELLDEALERLSPKARAVFLLHRRDGLSIEEICARLQISRPMAKKYLLKALLKFRKTLERADQG